MEKVTCPGCGLVLETEHRSMDDKFNASSACRALYDNLTAFTLSLGDKEFIHQLVVDSYAAQHSGPRTKPVQTVFALIGLSLTFEHGFTGKRVQLAHMAIARVRREYPRLTAPKTRSWLTVKDALDDTNNCNYKAHLGAWGRSVWEAWDTQHGEVERLVNLYLP